MPYRIDLGSPKLFGSEAAELEDESLFRETLLDRVELTRLRDCQNAIVILTAYKGEGKTALLRAVATETESQTNALTIFVQAPNVAPKVDGKDPSTWNRAWRTSLLSLIAAKLGTLWNLAWTDDAMALVEEAEKQGFRSRSIFSAVFDRIKLKLKLGSSDTGLELGRTRIGPANVEETIRRVDPEALTTIWLVLDDADRNFSGSKQDRAKLVGLFDALRELVVAVPQLRVRTAIRPNVWAVLRPKFESLSHLRESLCPIRWSEEDMRALLARRVEGYLVISGQRHEVPRTKDTSKREVALIEMVFESPVPWGTGTRPVHVPLYTLAAHRPRWVIELCKLAAAETSNRRHSKIPLGTIADCMGAFGANRIQDLTAEFGLQSKDLRAIVDLFFGKSALYTQAELLAEIEATVLSRLTPTIVGIGGKATAVDVATLLFEAGVFFARRELEGGAYQHIPFADRPTLFKSASPGDAELRCEFHPAFRRVLGMRT